MSNSSRFLLRAWRFLIRISAHIVVFVVSAPLLPIALFRSYQLRHGEKSHHVLFAGLEHVIEKTLARGAYWERNAYRPLYYSFESSRYPVTTVDPNLIRASKWLAIDAYRFASLLAQYRPLYVEIYYGGWADNGLCQWLYVVLCRLSRTMNIVILRGEIYYADSFSRPKRYCYRRALQATDRILYRETYMPETLTTLGVSHAHATFDPNKVKVTSEPCYSRGNNVLYLNSMKSWRRVDLLIKAIPIVAKSCSDFSVTIVGAQHEAERQHLLEMVRQEGVERSTRIELWTNKPRPFYEQAAIFVLPADLVYLNFSLLEAMERGVVPIIADVADADKIVTDGDDGFICKQDASHFAQKIVHLLKDPVAHERMAKRAREKVDREFNDRDRMQPVIEALRSFYGSREPGLAALGRETEPAATASSARE